MSGIYIHIPFCTKACFYCDFHFSVNKKNRPEMTQAILAELTYFGKNSAHNFFMEKPVETIYLGGGTPSVLPISELESILKTIKNHYLLNTSVELTLEANPDDLTPEYCKHLSDLGINRLSIGIQSFYDEHLQWMNRSHHARQANECIEHALAAGIDNISIDLIYGFPGLSADQWHSNLQTAQTLPINHLSSYCLTVEDRTPLKKLIESKRYLPPDDHISAEHFNILQDWASATKWEHYEISNLCRNGYYSKHNTGYWKQNWYLGIGPSAHSFNQNERRWNVKDNKKYIETWQKNTPQFESERLTPKEKLNDYILTSLRTQWGLDLDLASNISSSDFIETRHALIEKFTTLDLLMLNKNILTLSPKGKLYADGIASEFFEL